MSDDEYVRLTAPSSFTTCTACEGWLLKTDTGYARHAPLGDKVCACAKPTITQRRVTFVQSVLVKAATVPEVQS